MADRPDSDREVLTSLPRTRPVRRSAKRAERPRTAAAATKPTPAGADGAKARKPPAKARKPPAKPRAAAQPRAGARPAAADGARAKAARTRSAPRQGVPPAGYAAPAPPGVDEERSSSADLLGTAVQAASELAQIGCAVGRQALRSMLDRLPKP